MRTMLGRIFGQPSAQQRATEQQLHALATLTTNGLRANPTVGAGVSPEQALAMNLGHAIGMVRIGAANTEWFEELLRRLRLDDTATSNVKHVLTQLDEALGHLTIPATQTVLKRHIKRTQLLTKRAHPTPPGASVSSYSFTTRQQDKRARMRGDL